MCAVDQGHLFGACDHSSELRTLLFYILASNSMGFYRTFLLLLFLPFGQTLLGQSGWIEGVVTNQDNGDALGQVLVYNQDFVSATTDDKGFYKLALEPGTHLISYRLMAFESKSIEVLVESGKTTTINVQLGTSFVDIDQVVVSAGRFEQKLSELTVSVDVVHPDIVEDRVVTSIDDMMQNVSGVAIVDGETQMRGGSGYSFGAGSRVAILVDDMSMLSGDAGRPSWGFLPVENIEQIEVVKGASSVLYGSSALSGVMNIRTGFPESKPKTKFNVFHGFYDSPRTDSSKYWDKTPMLSGASFYHSRTLGNLGLVVGLNFLGDDGHLGPMFGPESDSITPSYNPFEVNRYEAEYRLRGNVNLRYKSNRLPGLSFGVNSNWLKGESMATLLWDNTSTGLYSAFDGSATRTKQVIANVDPYVRYVGERGSRHDLRMRWQKLDNDNDNNQGNFSDVVFGEYQVRQSLASIGLKNLKLTAGIAVSHTNSESPLYAGGENEGINTADNTALYAQLDQKIGDRLNLSAGLRYEYFTINDEFESKPIFRSGLNYQLGDFSYLRASYGQGYRFPTIAEKFISTQVGLLTIYPNEDLTSENSTSYEVGFKQGYRLGRFEGFFDLALFHQEYEDFVEFTFGQWAPQHIDIEEGIFDLGVGFRSLNTGEATISGAELSFNGRAEFANFGLIYSLGYTYTLPLTKNPDYEYAYEHGGDSITYFNTSSDPSDNILKYRIQHMFRSDVALEYGSWQGGFSVRTNSAMKNIDQVYLDLDEEGLLSSGIIGWRDSHDKTDVIIDMRLSYQITEKHLLRFVVNNVTNLEYAMRPLAIEAPRSIRIQYNLTL